MKHRLSAHEVLENHLFPLVSACLFIGIFVITVPMVYVMELPVQTERLLFTTLFAVCHVANWPMLQLRWRLWFKGRLTPYAAIMTTALLTGSFGIPFVLLVQMIT